MKRFGFALLLLSSCGTRSQNQEVNGLVVEVESMTSPICPDYDRVEIAGVSYVAASMAVKRDALLALATGAMVRAVYDERSAVCHPSRVLTAIHPYPADVSGPTAFDSPEL